MKFARYSFIFVFVLSSVLFTCQRQSETTTSSPEAITVDNTISADGVSIRYQVQGSGKPALFFVHGWCGNRRNWKAQLPYFAQRHKVVAVDLAGHGESGFDRKAWTMELFGQDVVAVVEKLGLEQIVLIGWSMGDKVIVEAARLMPKRVIGIIGVDNFRSIKALSQEQIDEFAAPFRVNFEEALANFIQSLMPPNADIASVEKIRIAGKDGRTTPPGIALTILEEYFKNDITPGLKEIKVPVRCINSDLVPTNTEAVRHYSPSFKALIMSGVGHFPPIEDPETFNRVLAEVVEELVQMKKSE